MRILTMTYPENQRQGKLQNNVMIVLSTIESVLYSYIIYDNQILSNK